MLVGAKYMVSFTVPPKVHKLSLIYCREAFPLPQRGISCHSGASGHHVEVSEFPKGVPQLLIQSVDISAFRPGGAGRLNSYTLPVNSFVCDGESILWGQNVSLLTQNMYSLGRLGALL